MNTFFSVGDRVGAFLVGKNRIYSISVIAGAIFVGHSRSIAAEGGLIYEQVYGFNGSKIVPVFATGICWFWNGPKTLSMHPVIAMSSGNVAAIVDVKRY